MIFPSNCWTISTTTQQSNAFTGSLKTVTRNAGASPKALDVHTKVYDVHTKPLDGDTKACNKDTP